MAADSKTKPSKLRQQIYALRHDIDYPGHPEKFRPWTEIASMLGLKEPSVRYNYQQYVKKLGGALQGQKAQVVAVAIANGNALPRPETQVLTAIDQVNGIIETLSIRLAKTEDDAAYCGVSMTLLKFLKFKQKNLADSPEVVTGDEMMTVLVQAIGEEDDTTKHRILNKIVDLLGENLTSVWQVRPPGAS